MCVNVPCQNGGVCSQAGSSFTCQCAPGYTGNTCTQVISEYPRQNTGQLQYNAPSIVYPREAIFPLKWSVNKKVTIETEQKVWDLNVKHIHQPHKKKKILK